MALVDSVDYVAKRIYLHADTIDADVDTVEVYKEVRSLRRTDESHRKFRPIIIAGGNVEKITGSTYTAKFVQLLYGTRLVPYNGTGDHKIKLVRDTFTDDGFAGRDCFDRSENLNQVDIDVDFPEIEIRTVAVGSGLDAGQDTKLTNIDSLLSSIEGSFDHREAMRLVMSVLMGKVSGAGTGTETFRDTTDAKDRVVVTVDASGNRTVVVLDET